MTLDEGALLFSAAVIGGLLNSVAGGGSFVSFPMLIFTGMPPINANATNTVALWPGTVASTGAYRKELKGASRRLLVPFMITGLAGGLLGAMTLLKTPQATFMRLVPYLLGGATLLFAASGRINAWIRARSIRQPGPRPPLGLAGGVLLELLIAIYVGFFGAGAGILTLALLAVMGMEGIHAMNGLKTLMISTANGVAMITFIVAGAVVWPQALLMVVGAAGGGYAGAYYAQKMDPGHVRLIVILVGVAITAYFFAKHGF
jgi:uncharacterized membrane protein YfcA